MRSTWKRALSAILTVCMIATLLVVPAAAANTATYYINFNDQANAKNTTDSGTFFTTTTSYKSGATPPTGEISVDGETITFVAGSSNTTRPLKLDSSGKISFTSTEPGTLRVVSNVAPKLDGTAMTGAGNVFTAEVAADAHEVTKGSAETHVYYVSWTASSTTSEFVTGVKITDDKDNENLNADVRSQDVTLNLKAAVTGGTSGTVAADSWKVFKGEDEVTDGTVTVTGNDDGKTAVVNVAANAVRGQYTIKATSTDLAQATEGGESTHFTGSATLRVRRAVVDNMTLTAPSSSTVEMKMGDEPVAVEIATTWVTADGDCIIQPASDAKQVTFASQDTDVVTVSTGEVDNDGKATLTAVGVGSTTVTATSTRNGEDGQPKVVTLNVTVGKGDTTLVLSQPRNTQVVAAGGYLLFELTGLPSNAAKAPHEYVSVTPSEGVTVSAPSADDRPYDEGSEAVNGWNVKVALPANTSDTDDVEYTVAASYGTESNDLWNVADADSRTVKVLSTAKKNIKVTGQTGSGATVAKTSGDTLTLSADAVLNESTGDPAADQTGLTFTWKKGGQELTAGGNISISNAPCAIEGHTGHTESTLTITGILVADAGAYTCEVSHADVDTPATADFTVTVAKKEGTVPTADVDASTRVLSNVQAGWKYSLDGNGETAHWQNIDGTSVTIPATVEGVDMTAVQGIYVQDPGDDETLPAFQHIELTRATTPVLEALDGALKITNYQEAYKDLYQYKTASDADWTDATVTEADDKASATISGLTNGTEYQVRVKYGKYILQTLVPATGTPAEPAGDPTELKTLIQEAKNKVIGIWYADNAADVLAGQKFVSVTGGTTYNEAIKAAETVANAVDGNGAPSSTTTELNAAKAKLEEAMSTFDGLEKKDGTKKQDAFILNMNEVATQKLTSADPANSVTGLGTQGFFTLLGNKSGSTDAAVEGGDALFADGFYGHVRWNAQGKVEVRNSGKANEFYCKAIQFTTTVANSTVKVWARNNGSTGNARHIGVIGQATVTGTTDYAPGEYKVETLTLAAAGTYYLGAADSTLHIYRVEVVQPGVDPVPTAYDITVAAAENGTVKTTVGGEEADSAYEGDEVTIVATPANTGFAVDTVKVTKNSDSSEVAVTENKFTMPAEAVTVTVTFKSTGITPTTSTITKAPTTNGSFTVKVGGVEVTEAVEGATVVITPTATSGYEVDTVTTAPTATVTEEDDGTYTFAMPGEAVTVTVTFKEVQVTPTEHNITVTAGEHGTATASAAKATKGTEITLTIAPEQGYEVDQITSADVTVANNKFTMPDKDVTINVTFKQTQTTPSTKYTVTVADAEHGTVSVDKDEAAEGDEVTITFAPETGYIVESIVVKDADGTGVDVTDNKFTMPAKNVTVTVTFRATSVTPPEVNKDELNKAIADAKKLDTTLATSVDGSDIDQGVLWVTEKMKTDLTDALAAAEAVAADADQTTVDAAAKALTDAIAAYKPAEGKKLATDVSGLDAAVKAAKAKMEGVLTSTNGKDVDPDKTWVTAAVKKALEDAIAKAEEVIAKADPEATTEEITEAAEALAAASEAFVPAAGTKTSTPVRPSHGGGTVSTPVSDKKTETLPDGTKRETETAKDGTVTVTDTLSDGTKTVTVTTPEGESTTTVTLGRGTESVQVSIPVEDATSGMVAVIVKPDGTEEIIRDSVVVDGEVVFDLDKDATVKVVDKTKSFVDVPGHWAESDVNFVAARDLFNGVSSTHFAPDATMTRGMMATVLFRLDGETKADKSVDFSDVTVEDWFAEAVDWAAEEGVITGYTDGSFGPDRSITREELVVMIYRYAGAPEVDAAMGMAGFNDVDQISTWAEAAMRWAVQNGIIQGKGNGTLDPQGNASRAEVSAVLQRYVKLAK